MTDAPPTPQPYLVKRRGAIGTARANFSCNSTTCRTKKGARVYELPAATTRCAVCGSKRIQRLMSAPHISRGIAKSSDALLEPDYTRQKKVKDSAKEANRVTPMFAVPMNQLAGRLAQFGATMPVLPNTPARPSATVNDPDLAGLKAAGMVRVPTARDRAWTPSRDETAHATREAARRDK